jgi:hypothetical protein
MKRTLLIVVVAVVLLAVASTMFAPASLVAPYVDQATQRSIQATAVEGTLWSGRATLVGSGTQVPVTWTFAPLPLLTGEARLDVAPVDAAASSPRVAVRATRDRMTISDLAVALPASVLQPLLQRQPAMKAWTMAGELTASAPLLAWTPAAWSGGLDLEWRGAVLTPPGVRPVAFGDVSARLAAAGDRLAGPVVNRGGDLDVRGDLAVGANGDTALSLLLTPRNPDDADLAKGLAAVGTAEGQGWRVGWQVKRR